MKPCSKIKFMIIKLKLKNNFIIKVHFIFFFINFIFVKKKYSYFSCKMINYNGKFEIILIMIVVFELVL